MDKDKIYDPARHNERSPEPGFASVNTHAPEEEQAEPLTPNQIPQRNQEDGGKKAAPDPL